MSHMLFDLLLLLCYIRLDFGDSLLHVRIPFISFAFALSFLMLAVLVMFFQLVDFQPAVRFYNICRVSLLLLSSLIVLTITIHLSYGSIDSNRF